MRCIEVRHLKLAKQSAGIGAGRRQARGRRTIFGWGTVAEGVAIEARNWADAIAAAKAEHDAVKEWQQDLPRAGKCQVQGETCAFRRWKGLLGGEPFRIRVVALEKGHYLAQVWPVGIVDSCRARAS